jgi:hypothetical protein
MNRILLSLSSDLGKAICSTKVSMPMTIYWECPESMRNRLNTNTLNNKFHVEQGHGTV